MDKPRRTGFILLFAGLCLASGLAFASKDRARGAKVYKWVDEDGVTHYGDQIPPEHAAQDREILNQYGVPVSRQEGTPDAAAEDARRRANAARQAAVERDQVLLSTYLSVAEIEALRDRRLELMDGQIRQTENYLATLRAKLDGLQKEAAAFQPYSTDPEAPPIDDKLAGELADTMDSIARYEKTLKDTRTRQEELSAEFEADIARFRELTTPPAR